MFVLLVLYTFIKSTHVCLVNCHQLALQSNRGNFNSFWTQASGINWDFLINRHEKLPFPCMHLSYNSHEVLINRDAPSFKTIHCCCSYNAISVHDTVQRTQHRTGPCSQVLTMWYSIKGNCGRRGLENWHSNSAMQMNPLLGEGYCTPPPLQRN